MPRRWRFVTLAVLLLILGTALALPAIASRRGRLITRGACERIEVGMTLKEVEAVIGLPPGDYTVFRYVTAVEAIGPEFILAWAGNRFEVWNSDNGVILVIFRDGKVISREFGDASGGLDRDFLDVLGRIVPGPWSQEEALPR